MYFILILTLCVLVFMGVYNILTAFIIVPSGRSVRTLKNMKNSPYSLSQKLYNATLRQIVVKIAHMIKMDKHKKIKLENDLKKLNIDLSAEEFTARALVVSAAPIPLIVLFLMIGGIIGMTGAVGCLIISITQFFNAQLKVSDKLKNAKEEIVRELPRFVGSFEQSYSSNRDYVKIFEKYRKICGEALKYDLDILLYDLKTINHTEALERFDKRINIPQMSSFISGVIGISTKGTDPHLFFLTLERDMEAIELANLDKEIEKRKPKVKKATVVMALCILALLVAPLVNMFIAGTNSLLK